MNRKFLTLKVIPHGRGKVRSLRVSYRTLRVLATLAGIFVLAEVAAIVTYTRIAGQATRAAMLERENAKLTEENRKVGEIATNLERTERAYEQIRGMAGLPPSSVGRVETDPGAAVAVAADDSVPPPVEGDTATPAGWPLTIEGFVTAEFSGSNGHTGIDIAVPEETPVITTADGIVREVGDDEVYGRYVIIRHDGPLETMYAHNSMIVVEQNAAVERGETIGYSGNSGESSAPHLHYEIRRGGRPVDPAPYMR